ncbi:hypothetical protein FIV42_03965 [Persicimonas caeni]|uniref:Lipoprotein n=1 Tax=Persicimonas caeni TaxID=2292766 RepID=A0A4Y6PQ88_PERCE|nr:DUF6184 family natural product biosynthesis lipoprotein [Persicimonas caeni]QDG49925.1 hypothetical protein FIV42_03965 [Persicimonas caeni]QED31146.1 hypothetical protein FRD00_03960 [Persicimonas caeni]
MKRSLLITLGATLLVVSLSACETTRADYRDDIAQSVCQQMRECDAFGKDAEFADYDDCVTELESTYNDLWPADECSNGRIDKAKFDQCKQRAVSQACDENILDMVSFRLQCSADDVCVAEPKK